MSTSFASRQDDTIGTSPRNDGALFGQSPFAGQGPLAAERPLGGGPGKPGASKPAGEPPVTPDTRNLDAVMRIPVTVQVILGSATMPVANLMKLGRGAVVPLDHRVGAPVDVVVNGRVIARGEVVVLEEDNSRFGVSLTEIAGPPGFTFSE